MNAIEELDKVPTKISAQEAQLARQVIDTFEGELDLRTFRDDYQDELRKLIDAKVKGQEFVAPEEEAPAKVANLMEALRKSLDAVSTGRKKQANAELPQAKAASAPRAPKAAAPKRKRA
jgi:DNA end-binding protein Ku